jgi:hypothetical protein
MLRSINDRPALGARLERWLDGFNRVYYELCVKGSEMPPARMIVLRNRLRQLGVG